MKGFIISVDDAAAGVDVLEDAASGALTVVGVDAVDLLVDGGSLVLPSGAVVEYVSVDVDEDVVTLVEPLPEPLVEGDRLTLLPARQVRTAVVQLDGGGVEVVPVRVPHAMQPSVPVGVRDGDPELVVVELRADGSFWLVDVRDRPPSEVWGDPLGAAMEMRDTGLTAWAVGPEGRYEASTFGSGQDRLGVFNAAGQIVGGVTAGGQVVGQSGAIAGDMSVGGVPMMGRLWDNSPGAPVGWFERFAAGDVASVLLETPAPVRAATEEWGYAKIGFTARAGRSYVVQVTSALRTVTVAGGVRTRLRYATGGAEPTLSSNTLGPADYSPSSVQGGYYMTVTTRARASFTSDTSVNVMFTTEGLGSAQVEVSRAYFEVQDLGPQGSYGGGTYTTGREVTPPPTVREYASTWTATAFRVYDGTGQPDATKAAPYQWGIGSEPTPDRSFTALLFDGPATSGSDVGATITDAKTGATITKAEVFLTNTQWALLDAGEVALGKGGFASLPLTLAPQATVKPRDWPTGAGMWVEVPTSWFTDTNRVVTLGDIDQAVHGGVFMGPGDDFPPQVRLTYTK